MPHLQYVLLLNFDAGCGPRLSIRTPVLMSACSILVFICEDAQLMLNKPLTLIQNPPVAAPMLQGCRAGLGGLTRTTSAACALIPPHTASKQASSQFPPCAMFTKSPMPHCVPHRVQR